MRVPEFHESQSQVMRSEFDNLDCELVFEKGRTSILRNRFEDVSSNEICIVEVARNYMRENFSSKIRVDQVAKSAFVSQYHFSRIFKKHTQYSPYQYLLNLRLGYAKTLMERTSFSIKEIAYLAGFSSLDYFSAAFTKKYSLCPSLYRKTKLLPERKTEERPGDRP